MKSIHFRKKSKITRKNYKDRKKRSRKNTKKITKKLFRKMKTKNYFRGGAEPTEEEKMVFFGEIMLCIDGGDKDGLNVLLNNARADLLNMKFRYGDVKYIPLLFFLLDSLAPEYIEDVVKIFRNKGADMNITFDNMADAPLQKVMKENILFEEICFKHRSDFIELFIENGIDPNHMTAIVSYKKETKENGVDPNDMTAVVSHKKETDENDYTFVYSLKANVITHCCRFLCMALTNRSEYENQFGKDYFQKMSTCFQLLLNNVKVDINQKAEYRHMLYNFNTVYLVPLHYTMTFNQYDLFKLFLENDRIDPNIDIFDTVFANIHYYVNIINMCIYRTLFDFAKLLVINKNFKINIETREKKNPLKCYSPLTILILRVANKYKFNNDLIRQHIDLLEFFSQHSDKIDVNYRPTLNDDTPLMLAIINADDVKNIPSSLITAYLAIDILFKFQNIDVTLEKNGVNVFQLAYDLKNESLFEKILENVVQLFINESTILETSEPLQKFDKLISGFNDHILKKTPVLKNDIQKLISNESYKKKYGNVINQKRKQLQLEVDKYNPIRELNDDALIEYINGPPKSVESVKKSGPPKSVKKSDSEPVKKSGPPKSVKKSDSESGQKTNKVNEQIILPPHPLETVNEPNIPPLAVAVNQPNILPPPPVKVNEPTILPPPLTKEELMGQCAEIHPYWADVIVKTNLITNHKPYNFLIYKYFVNFKTIINELIVRQDFEMFKTKLIELIPYHSLSFQYSNNYTIYEKEMYVFSFVITFLSHILYESKTCILYFKGGKSFQMYMEHDSNDFDFLILPYYDINMDIDISKYDDNYKPNNDIVKNHKEIALEIYIFISWIFKGTGINFSSIDTTPISDQSVGHIDVPLSNGNRNKGSTVAKGYGQNSIIKISLVKEFGHRSTYIPFTDIGYGFEYFDNKIKSIFLSRVYGENFYKAISGGLQSDSLELGLVYPSLQKLLYERLYYLYIYKYTNPSAENEFFITKLIPQLEKLSKKIREEDPNFNTNLNKFINDHIVSPVNTSINEVFIREVNHITNNDANVNGKGGNRARR